MFKVLQRNGVTTAQAPAHNGGRLCNPSCHRSTVHINLALILSSHTTLSTGSGKDSKARGANAGTGQHGDKDQEGGEGDVLSLLPSHS